MSFAVYRSSAGSGKTFTLVKEYLKLILTEPGEFRHILAITFTNKAANEMKERILGGLEELAKGEESENKMVSGTLLPILLEETGLTRSEIARISALSLEMILHNYADFAIGTIDSFSHKLIRTFAHDFGLPVNFNVELDGDEMLATAVDLLLDRVGDDADLTALLVNFLETRMDEDRGWNIDFILASFAHILMDEEGQSQILKIKQLSLSDFQRISENLYISLRRFEKDIRELGLQAAAMIRSRDIPSSAFYQGEKGIWKYFMNLAAGRMDKLEPNSFVMATLEEDKWCSAKAAPALKNEIDAIKPGLTGIYGKLRTEFEQSKPAYMLQKLLAKTIYPLAVLNEIEKVLNQFKQQNNLVHISEFNARIAGVVMNEPVPFIYERLGEKYHHLFIDEFQDTSALQWMNYIPLIENALAGGYFNMVVGDGKQAIYRWRGGDVEQFTVLPAIPGSLNNMVLQQREQALTRSFKPVNLDSNFRSKAEIVDFNNRFFSKIAGNVLSNGKEDIYSGLTQVFNPEDTGGYIRLSFLERGESAARYDEFTFVNILEIIRENQRNQYSLNDIAILCRSNRNASKIARFLLENGIGVLSAESLLVANSPKVRFLVACLRYLFEPQHDVVVEEIRQFLENIEAGSAGIRSLNDDFALLPVFDLCEALLRKFGLNRESDAYVQFFLDAVLKFSVKTSTSSLEFLAWWEKNKDKVSIIVPEGIDAVRVTTIHKAKGLQFPVVIMPYALEGRKNTKTHLWVSLDPVVASGLETAILRSDKEMESTVYRELYSDEQQKSMLDILNLLYVAMTRPEERLYILTKAPAVSRDIPDSWPRFFDFFVKSEGIWEENKSVYEFGYLSDHVIKSHKEKINIILANNLINIDWREKIHIRMRAPQLWGTDADGGKPQWGNRVHTLLSWIKTEKDIAKALTKATSTGLIGNEDCENLEKLLTSVICYPQLSRLFSDQVRVKTEAEILLPQGSFYRPDRVVFDGEQVTILDYKSGKPLEEHKEQLIRYAGYLEEMGYLHIRRALVYLEPEVTVVEV